MPIKVTNRDECVTVKSPSSNILVERIWCNQSGGSAIGSMGAGTAIENILYRNVYTNGGNQIFMIKSWGGDGYLRNVVLQNFIARGTAYGLNVNQYCTSLLRIQFGIARRVKLYSRVGTDTGGWKWRVDQQCYV